MFLKIVKKRYKDKVYRYGAIVESVRKNGKPTHRVVQNLGRLETEEDFRRAREMERAYKEGERIVRLGDISISETREFGILWTAEELWDKCGIFDAIRSVASDAKLEFDFERIVFLLAVNRLYDPSSDLSALRWIEEEAYPRTEVEKQWIYRSLDKLVDVKEELEVKLLENLREKLGISLNLVFYDLTSSYFEGAGPEMAEFGHSRDRRPDREQIILGVLIADGIPIAHKVWPGNTADKSTLREAVKDLKGRLGIEKVAFVADRGVISSPNLEEIEEMGYDYILSTKRRRDELVKDLLVEDVPGSDEVRAREVLSTDGRRYVLCLNEERREDDLRKLDSIREDCEKKLEDLSKRFAKSREGKTRGRPMTRRGAMRRVEKILGRNRRLFDIDIGETIEWSLDEEAWEYERAIAGKFLLVTTSDLSPWEVVIAYKDLKDVEHAFDELKNLLKLRPFYHRTNGRVRGHVIVCHLALLTKRLITQGSYSNKRLQGLKRLKIHKLEVNGESVWIRNEVTSNQQTVLDNLNVEKPSKFMREV